MADRSPVKRRIATRIRELRVRQGLSQARLAELAHTSRSQVVFIENGRRAPSISTLESFARALGVSLTDLVADEAEGRARRGHSPDRADRLASTVRSRGPRFLSAVEKVVRAMSEVVARPARRAR